MLLELIRDRIVQVRRDCGLPADPARFHAGGADAGASRRWLTALEKGTIFFYDTQPVSIGLKSIDWSGRHVAHQEWPAQLNRFYWLDQLARVYADDRDPRAPRLARLTIEDWMDQRDPYGAARPIGEGDSTLNLSIRLGQADVAGWWQSAATMTDSGDFDESFVQRMLASSRGQLEYLCLHLSPYGNWRISHLNCVLFCALVLPGFEEYAPFAARGLREAFYRQVEADGSHCEHTPGYHGWMADVATRLWRLSRARPDLRLDIDRGKLLRMADYALASAAPDGRSAGLHDSEVWSATAGVAANLRRERDALRDELALPREQIWDPDAEPSRWFPDAGQLFLRDSWAPSATFITFDATRWGGGHSHLSRLAVGLYAGRRMLLHDPGIFSYEVADPFMAHGKSTPAHNTITVNGGSQSQANPDRPEAHLLDRYAVARASYLGGYHPGRYTWQYPEGPGPGTYATHQRSLLWIKGRGLIVFDRVLVYSTSPAAVAAHWQFPAGPCRLDAAMPGAWTEGGDDNVLVRCVYASAQALPVLYEGQADPPRGWLPTDVYGGRTPAPMLALETEARGRPVDMVTLIVPFRGDAVPRPDVRVDREAADGACRLDLRWNESASDVIVFNPGLVVMAGRSGPIETDGVMACVSLDDGKPRSAMVHAGFRLAWQGRALIDRPEGGTWEWGSA